MRDATGALQTPCHPRGRETVFRLGVDGQG